MSSPSNPQMSNRGKTPPPPYEMRKSPPPLYEMDNLAIAPAEDQYWTEPHDIVKDISRMHPLIAAAHHNRTQNPLCRLPDTILVRMMRLLDPVTLECLRRCSRIFLRLFPMACASLQDFDTTWSWRFPWPTSRLQFRPEEKDRFLSLIARDGYCCDCLAARQRSDWQERFRAMAKVYLHCCGCQADHPTYLFSIKQRYSPLSSRICIGHEGYLRLCEHEIVTWPQIISAAKKLSNQRGRVYRLKHCGRFEHIVHCRHRVQPVSMISTPKDNCCPPHPTVSVGYPKNHSEIVFQIDLYWSAHLPMTLTQDRCFKPEELARGITYLRTKGAQFICPQVKPGHIAGAGLFDPNCCDCLDYEGRELTAWDRPLSRDLPLSGADCRHNPTLRFGRDEGGQDPHTSRCTGGFSHSRGKCFANVAWRAPTINGTVQGLRTEVKRCPNGENCVKVAHASFVDLPLDKDGALRQMSSGWYQVLDPDSYHLTEDWEGFGVYWCKAKDCKNYYRFNQSRLKPLVPDYRHACPQ
ncbi:hypothetical protein QBC46DRAFT_428423 [Diplogelasinospora grovesii]|uniref:F-box domain-containing protein n=1 Tax=Diplogelasinospora grovesii TaxID=303347 RepID=A0AAN6S6R3_9PEZI|nr:hypothetical protein QBC46DRAFT_428423 [Diplogelasinospora grovesii]